MTVSSHVLKLFSCFFLFIIVAKASFFAEELPPLHLPSWFTNEFQNIHFPNVKEIPWSKLSPGQLFSQGSSALTPTKEDREKALATTTMTPIQTKALALDFRETDQHFELDVDFPGMKKEEISVKTDGNILTISGERKFTNEKDEGKYHKIERYYGHTRRSVAMPPNAALENITASYEQGVLHISLPKESDDTCLSPTIKKIPIA